MLNESFQFVCWRSKYAAYSPANAIKRDGTSIAEFRFAYGVSKNMNLVARLYIVDAIDIRSTGAVSKEDGNRFRIDLNYKFQDICIAYPWCYTCQSWFT